MLSVVFSHAGFSQLSGGFLGVDVFFVISGFLITRIILDEIEAGTFSLRTFYERRIRRILPAVCFVLMCTVPFAWLTMVPFQFHEFSRSILATLFFVSNIFFWKNSSYFDASADTKPLLHTWSLAVEEQFYFFFPLLLLFVWRFGRNRALMIVIALTTISLLVAEFIPSRYATASFFLLPTRAWEIGVGCILAFYPGLALHTPKPIKEALSSLGLVALVASFFVLDHKMLLPGFLSLLPVLGTALVIAFADRGTIAARFLSSKGAVAIGAISFSLYLWHQPVFAFSRLHFGSIEGWQTSLALIGVSVLLAILSYRFVETPFRGRGARSISFSTTAAVILSLYGVLASYSVFALYEERNDQFLLADYADHPAIFDAQIENVRRSEWMEDPVNLANYLNTQDFPGARIMILGDSHSTSVYNLIQSQSDISKDFFPVRVPLFNGCLGSDPIPAAEQFTRDCISRYLDVEERDLFEPATHVVIGLLWTKFSDEPEHLEIVITATIDEIQKRGKVAVISPGAYHAEPMVPLLLWRLFRQGNLEKGVADRAAFDVMRADVPEVNDHLEAVSRAAGADVFNRFEVMCSMAMRQCHALTPDGRSVYTDGHHTTVEGAIFFGEIARARGMFDIFLPSQ